MHEVYRSVWILVHVNTWILRFCQAPGQMGKGSEVLWANVYLKLADLVRPKSDMRKEWSTAQNLYGSWPYEIARKDKVVKKPPKILKDIHSMYGSGAC